LRRSDSVELELRRRGSPVALLASRFVLDGLDCGAVRVLFVDDRERARGE
jgi:hypothetical protein